MTGEKTSASWPSGLVSATEASSGMCSWLSFFFPPMMRLKKETRWSLLLCGFEDDVSERIAGRGGEEAPLLGASSSGRWVVSAESCRMTGDISPVRCMICWVTGSTVMVNSIWDKPFSLLGEGCRFVDAPGRLCDNPRTTALAFEIGDVCRSRESPASRLEAGDSGMRKSPSHLELE